MNDGRSATLQDHDSASAVDWRSLLVTALGFSQAENPDDATIHAELASVIGSSSDGEHVSLSDLQDKYQSALMELVTHHSAELDTKIDALMEGYRGILNDAEVMNSLRALARSDFNAARAILEGMPSCGAGTDNDQSVNVRV